MVSSTSCVTVSSIFCLRGRYAESVLPVLAVAQQKLSERAQENGGVSCTQPDVEISPESGKPEGVTITPKNYISIEPAVHIDPKGHDVYNEANDALRLFCVPIDKKHTLQMLRHCVELKHSGARALQHSRQLLSRYLAGLCKLEGNFFAFKLLPNSVMRKCYGLYAESVKAVSCIAHSWVSGWSSISAVEEHKTKISVSLVRVKSSPKHLSLVHLEWTKEEE